VIRKKRPSRITVSFQAPHAGTFRSSLRIVFSDKSRRLSDREFVILRELSARATVRRSPARIDTSNAAIGHASASSEGTGISVSSESNLEFSLERAQLDVPFVSQNLELIINKSSSNPLVSFEGVNVRSPDGNAAKSVHVC